MGKWFMPDEADAHTRTWMAFGASEEIWGAELLPRVQEDLARIANAIARFEPVSMLVRAEDWEIAEELCDEGVELIEAEMDDLWIRDTGPCFVLNGDGRLGAVDLNFNGWGQKQDYDRDALVASWVARRSGAK